jgi:hypothetical protein
MAASIHPQNAQSREGYPVPIYRKVGYNPGPQPINGHSSASRIRVRQLGDARFTPPVLLSSRAIAGGLNLFRVCASVMGRIPRLLQRPSWEGTAAVPPRKTRGV